MESQPSLIYIRISTFKSYARPPPPHKQTNKTRCSYFQSEEPKESRNKAKLVGRGSCAVTRVIFLHPPLPRPSLLLFTLFSLLLISFYSVYGGNGSPTPNIRAEKTVINVSLLIQYPPSCRREREWDSHSYTFKPFHCFKCSLWA